MTTKVIIIGAGLAGIAAAVTLADAGYKPLLLERTSRLGGRAGSCLSHNGVVYPLGNHLFLGCCSEYRKLLDTLGVRNQTRLQKRMRLAVAHAGRIATLQAASLPQPLTMAPTFARYPFLNWKDKALVAKGMLAVLDESPVAPGETFAAWLGRRHQTTTARKFLWELISAPTLNAPAELAAAELALMVFKQAVLGDGQANSLGFLPSDPAALLAPIGDNLKQRNAQLAMSMTVRSLSPAQDGRRLMVTTQSGATYAADFVISAVPYWELVRLAHPEWLDLPCFANLTKLPSRPIVDVFLTFDTPQTTEDVIAIPGLPALWVFSETLPSGGQRLSVSISCPGDLATQSASNVALWTKEKLVSAFGHPLYGKMLDCQVRKHMRATFSSSPEHQSLRPTPITPVPGLILAGDYTATGWPATMEGAVRSGINAANAVIESCVRI